MNKFFYNRATSRICAKKLFYCDRTQNSHNAQKSKQTCLLSGQKHATFLFKFNFKFAKRSFIFTARWIRTQKVNAGRKIGQFFVGFFHILKRRKTALQLNRTETLQPVKKNADVILYTHGRAYRKILFITAQ